MPHRYYWIRIDIKEIHPHIFTQLIFDEGAKEIHVGKIVFSTNDTKLMLTNINLHFEPYTTSFYFTLYEASLFHPPLSHNNFCTSLLHCKFMKICCQSLDIQEAQQAKPVFSILLSIVCNDNVCFHIMLLCIF